MAEDTDFETGGSREYARVLLVACCLLAVVVAGTLVPALSAGQGVAGSPIESTLPDGKVAGGGANVSGGNAGGGAGGSGAGGSRLGALNPGSFTGVGGPIDTNAFRSQEATVHFTVRSSRPAYWRTGAYDQYTGAGWSQTGESRRYNPPIPTGGMQGPRVTYEVTLNRPATALPTVWRPRTVDGVSDLLVTDRRAVRTAGSTRLQAGTTFTGVSVRPPRDPTVLRASGRDYPRRIERRYATLPETVPDRVGQFTDRLTADADSPYETAKTIEAWLEANKTYSLNVSRRSSHVADTFIFEMDRGYCEYFATSMVVMLRTQGIPARYVVGYSTGQQVGENTYRVRNLNAHAWVEVYFEDVGWVKFDPTPGSARLQRERRAMQRQRPGTEYSPRERGSPGERFTAGNDTTTETPRNDPSGPRERSDDGLSVSLNRSAVPGATVQVTVTRDGAPVAGRTVLFNGEPVGTTGPNGTVVGTVPYAEQLRVTLAGSGDANAMSGGDRLFSAGGFALAGVTYPVETNATLTVTGGPRPGGTVAVTATVEGVPVADARVLLDGERVGTTNGEGRAVVRLPEESGNVTVAVERGPVSGRTTVHVPEFSVEVDPSAPLALPFTRATVTVRLGDRPVEGAPVFLDGRRVATTGLDGTATVTLPLSGEVTVAARDGSLSARATVGGLLVNLLLVLGGLLAAGGGVVLAAARAGYAPRELLALLRRLPGLAVRYAQLALVVLATRGGDALGAAAARLRTTGRYLVGLVRGRVDPAQLRAAFRAWYRNRRSGTPSGRPRGDRASEPRVTVRAAWRRFVEAVSVRRPETKTPGELATHAIERDDLPAGAVRTLRDTFREVEYGSRPADDRLDRVEGALSTIEERTNGSEDGTDGEREEGN